MSLLRYVRSRPITMSDPLGLEEIELGTVTVYATPCGTFDLGTLTADVDETQQGAAGGSTTDAYSVSYSPPSGVCQGRDESIKLVQALTCSGMATGISPVFDSRRKEVNEGELYPEYTGQTLDGEEHSLVDAPRNTRSLADSSTWTLTVCAICTTTLCKDGYRFVMYQNLGCVSFKWEDRSRSELYYNGTLITSQSGIAASSPDSLWNSALEAQRQFLEDENDE